MSEQKNSQGGFPKNQTGKPEEYSTTGDGHPPRTGERTTQEGMAGQGTGQMGSNADQMGQTTGGGSGQGMGNPAGRGKSTGQGIDQSSDPTDKDTFGDKV
ncbi:MAG: hypothetical protein WKF74_16600 [Pyrinomonadaceae bacterium]